jgi:hypothetical protein
MQIMEITDLPADLAGRSDAQTLLTSSISLAEALCRCEFGYEADIEEFHDGGNSSEIWLRRRPVTVVTSVTANGYEITDFSFNAKTGRLWRGNGYSHRRNAPDFPFGQENVAVVYSAGYTSAPDDMKAAIIDGMRGIINEQARDMTLKKESFAGDYSWEAADGANDPLSVFSPTAKTLLRKYRRCGQNVIGL